MDPLLQAAVLAFLVLFASMRSSALGISVAIFEIVFGVFAENFLDTAAVA